MHFFLEKYKETLDIQSERQRLGSLEQPMLEE